MLAPGVVEDDSAWLGYDPLFEVGAEFDRGLFIRSTELRRRPYSMYVGGRLQLRHTAFTRDEETWTDAAGVTREIRNRNDFETERARINISGTALHPDVTYLFILDGDSDGDANVDLLTYIFTYEVAPCLRIRGGRWKAASDREWLESSRFLRFADRSMGTEYFRAGFTDGVWLIGELGETWTYEASLTNGLRTSNRRPRNLDDNVALAATVFCDPWGAYGPGEVDYVCRASPVARFGMSCAFEKTDDRSDVGFPLGDANYLTLSDGTRLADTGALAPGVSLLSAQLLKASFDAGVKWRGWSLSGEYFLRSLQDLVADGAIPHSKLYDYGYHLDAGVFLVPKRLDINARMAQVSGFRGNAYEYTFGGNWYWGNGQHDGKLDDRVNKFTMDVTVLKGAPITSTQANFFAGDDGVLFRTQLQVGY